MSEFKVWECKVVVSSDADLPNGFDNPPRSAVIKAIEDAGVAVIACSSGWGGNLTKVERACLVPIKFGDSYIVGVGDE